MSPNRRKFSILIAIAGLLIAVIAGASPATAADSNGSYAPEPDAATLTALESALVDLQMSRATSDDLNLIKQYPQLTDDLEPVYTFGSSSVDAPALTSTAVSALATQTCRIYTGCVNAYSVISGSRLYTWHQRFYVCASGEDDQRDRALPLRYERRLVAAQPGARC